MAFQVNTNINAMNAHVQSALTQNALKTSLERLSSGLRINKAADDASGMTVRILCVHKRAVWVKRLPTRMTAWGLSRLRIRLWMSS